MLSSARPAIAYLCRVQTMILGFALSNASLTSIGSPAGWDMMFL